MQVNCSHNHIANRIKRNTCVQEKTVLYSLVCIDLTGTKQDYDI